MNGHDTVDVGVLDPATWSRSRRAGGGGSGGGPSGDGGARDGGSGETGTGDTGTGDTGTVSDAALVSAMAAVEAAMVGVLEPGPGTTPVGQEWTLPDPRVIAVEARGGGNPVIPLLAALRPQLSPAVAEVFHLGATSQDVLDTAMMTIARDTVALVRARARDVVGPLARLADEHRTTPVAGRTLGQHAAPTTFGLRVSVLLDGIVRSLQRLLAVELPVQWGGSVGTLAVLVDVVGVERASAARRELAARLGLSPREGVWHVDRTPVVELGSALAGLVGALGRLGLEIAHLSSTETGELVVVAADGEGGSSAMPQKRNPVAAVLLVSHARRAPGLASTLFASQLALDDRPSGDWHAEWQPLRELLRLTIESTVLAADALAVTRVDPARMVENTRLSHGAIHAERAQWALVPHVGRARAAELVRSALDGPDFVPALLAALGVEDGIDRAAAIERVRLVTTFGRPVGLSESLIDAAIAAAGGF